MTESVIIPINHIERKPDSNHYRVVGKGVTVEFLSRLINQAEWPIERICENYGLVPAEVYAAWAFYYDHQAEIDQHVEESAVRHAEGANADQPHYERLKQRYREKTGKSYPDGK